MNAKAASDLLHGGIFTLYIACFLFLVGYLMVRKRRGEQHSEIIDDTKKEK